MDKKSFKEKFPNLYREIEGGEYKVAINSYRTDGEASEEASCDKLRNFNPTVIDFIRRCDTEEEAKTIILFLEKRKEITSKRAAQLREQLKTKGVRSFGSKKEDNYYLKQGGY